MLTKQEYHRIYNLKEANAVRIGYRNAIMNVYFSPKILTFAAQ